MITIQTRLTNKKTLRSKCAQSGMAFLATITVLFIVLCMLLLGTFLGGGSGGAGTISTTSNATTMANVSLNQTAAFNLAESGVEYAMQWLREQSAPPGQATAFAPVYSSGSSMSQWSATTTGTPPKMTVTMTVDPAVSSAGTFAVTLYPDQNNATGQQHKYLIESTGTYNGIKQIVSAYVAQSSFAGYAYFTDIEASDGYWDTQLNSFDGPMHSNGANSSGVAGKQPTNIIWHNSVTSSPMFTYTGSDAFTTSASSIKWNKNSIGSMSAPSSISDWTHVAAGGSGTVQTGVPPVPMPTSSSIQMNAALGGSSAPTGEPSVVLPIVNGTTSGGLYIHAGPTSTVNEVVFSVTNSVVQNIEIDQTDNSTSPATTIKNYVTIDPTQGTIGTTTLETVTTKGSASTTTTTSGAGTTDGVVYSDSDIGTQDGSYSSSLTAWEHGQRQYGSSKTGGVHGVIADNYAGTSTVAPHTSAITIATANTANVNLDGSLTTNTQRQKVDGAYIPESSDPTFRENSGTLGLVSNTIEVVNKDYNGNAITNMEVDGSVLAYDTFDCTDIGGRAKGTFQVMGGYIAKEGGFFGVINDSGALQNGFAEHYNFDSRLTNTPPPYFPTTNVNYNILSWQRVSSTLQ